MTSAIEEAQPINVVAALKGSEFEDIAPVLAKEFKKVGITTKDQVGNAPLKIQTTHGADIYKVMELVTKHEVKPTMEAEEAPAPKRKTASKK